MKITLTNPLALSAFFVLTLSHCGVDKYECKATTGATSGQAGSTTTDGLKVPDMLGVWRGTWEVTDYEGQSGDVVLKFSVNDANTVQWDIKATGGHMWEDSNTRTPSNTLLLANGNSLPLHVAADDTDKLGRVVLDVTEQGKISGRFHDNTDMEGCIDNEKIAANFKLLGTFPGTTVMYRDSSGSMDIPGTNVGRAVLPPASNNP